MNWVIGDRHQDVNGTIEIHFSCVQNVLEDGLCISRHLSLNMRRFFSSQLLHGARGHYLPYSSTASSKQSSISKVRNGWSLVLHSQDDKKIFQTRYPLSLSTHFLKSSEIIRRSKK